MSCRDSTRPKTVGPPGRRPGDVGTRSSSSSSLSSLSPPPQQQKNPPPPHRRRKDFPGTPARFFGNTGGQCRLEDPGTSSLRCTDKACSHRPALVVVVVVAAVWEPSFFFLVPLSRQRRSPFRSLFLFFIYIFPVAVTTLGTTISESVDGYSVCDERDDSFLLRPRRRQ